ncbi:hypothetical protein BRD20_08755 [Halobacteriales archaeon SW_8_65_20]|nr:MAG: hypothetical protein BRD20_08755 [Halobacteriales archaeon SW_8_65_20]
MAVFGTFTLDGRGVLLLVHPIFERDFMMSAFVLGLNRILNTSDPSFDRCMVVVERRQHS